MKTSALSSSIYNQAAKVFKDNAALIGSKYKAFDTFAQTHGNPKVIVLKKQKICKRIFRKIKDKCFLIYHVMHQVKVI